MPKVCPKCGGFQVGCSVCGLPPKRKRPFDRRQMPRTTLITLGAVADELVWPVQYADFSGWNGIFDMSKYHTKCQVACVRLGYGNGWKDARCDQYRRDLIANDIPYFVYWYCQIGGSYEQHADGFAEVAAEFPGLIGYEEDFEKTQLLPVPSLTWIINFDTRLKSQVSHGTSPYSSRGFWMSAVAPNNYFTAEQWVANWTDGNAPWMPDRWIWKKGCKWQWSADGNGKAKEYGMIDAGDPDLDLNRYFGTVEEFNLRYATHILPIGDVIPPEPIPGFVMVCVTDTLTIREGPAQSYNKVGYIHKGDELLLADVDGSSAWMQIKEGPYSGKWCAVHTSKRWMTPK